MRDPPGEEGFGEEAINEEVTVWTIWMTFFKEFLIRKFPTRTVQRAMRDGLYFAKNFGPRLPPAVDASLFVPSAALEDAIRT